MPPGTGKLLVGWHIGIRHLTSVPRDLVKLLNEEIAREIHEIAQDYGWDNWLKIEWDVR